MASKGLKLLKNYLKNLKKNAAWSKNVVDGKIRELNQVSESHLSFIRAADGLVKGNCYHVCLSTQYFFIKAFTGTRPCDLKKLGFSGLSTLSIEPFFVRELLETETKFYEYRDDQFGALDNVQRVICPLCESQHALLIGVHDRIIQRDGGWELKIGSWCGLCLKAQLSSLRTLDQLPMKEALSSV